MNAIVEDLKSKNIEAEAKMEIGNPYKSISHLITDQKVDLVIMGSKGASGIQELLVGSNTEKVVRNANCPVLTVKEKIGLSKIKNYCHPTFFGLGE